MKLERVVCRKQFKTWVLEAKDPVLVDFYGETCPPCKRLMPILEELADDYKGKINIYKVASMEIDLFEDYEIDAVPFLKLFDEGLLMWESKGFKQKKTLKNTLDNYLKGRKTLADLEKKTLSFVEKYAKKKGYSISPDDEMKEMVIEGLASNKKKHGQLYCPCRIISGDKKKDKANICPCDYMEDEIKKDGSCHCGLFYDKKKNMKSK